MSNEQSAATAAELDELEKRLRGRALALRGVGGKAGITLRGKDAALDDDAADALAALRRERDDLQRRLEAKCSSLGSAEMQLAALRKRLDEAERDSRALERTHQAIPLEFCLDPPDGGDVKPWEAAERMAKALSEARAANAQMAAALRFYADPANWRDGSFSHDKPGVLTHHPNSVLQDHGKRARAALSPAPAPAISGGETIR